MKEFIFGTRRIHSVEFKDVSTQAKPPVSAVFGLQAERMITTTDANRDGVVAYRFKDNFPIQPPDSLTRHFQNLATLGFTPELKKWMLDENVDLLLHLDEKEYDVLSLDMRNGFAGQPTEWDTISPDRAAPLLAGLEKLNTNPGTRVAVGFGYRDGMGGVDVFRTRTGLVGYYQLRGLNDLSGRGVEIRYKLVLGGTTPTSVATPPLSFGPVIERLVNTIYVNTIHHSLDHCLINLASGELLSLPDSISTRMERDDPADKAKLESDMMTWAINSGADAAAGIGESSAVTKGTKKKYFFPNLATFGLITVPVTEDAWDKLAPADVADRLEPHKFPHNAKPEFENVYSHGSNSTYLFETRKGVQGILQIEGATPDRNGVKIHYKLVQNAATNAPATKLIQPGTPKP